MAILLEKDFNVGHPDQRVGNAARVGRPLQETALHNGGPHGVGPLGDGLMPCRQTQKTTKVADFLETASDQTRSYK